MVRLSLSQPMRTPLLPSPAGCSFDPNFATPWRAGPVADDSRQSTAIDGDRHSPDSFERRSLVGFSSRYDLGTLERELKEERPWILAVRSALLERAATAPIWSRQLIEGNVRWTLDGRLGARTSDKVGDMSED